MFSGVCQCLDVQFDDPSSGFFLRDASLASSSSASTVSSTNVVKNSGDVNGDDVKNNGDVDDDSDDEKMKPMPTTSIVLGENKDESTKHSSANYLGDILHSSR